MKKFILYTISILALNIVLAFILVWLGSLVISNDGNNHNYGLGTLLFVAGFFIVSLIIQLVAGLILITKEGKREIGKAMVLSVGIIFLLGLSVCSRM